MLKSFSLLMAAFLCSICFTATAQTADDVINNYINALGGKDKLASIKTVYMEGVSVMQNGTEINSKIWKDNGKLLRREVDFGAGNIKIVITDKEGWSTNPRSGGAWEALPAAAVEAQQVELDCAGPLVDYAAKGNKVELLGKEAINGKDCYKIKMTVKAGRVINFFIDASTWYIVRTVSEGTAGMFGGGGRGGQQGPNEVKIDFSDYKKTADGYVFPYTVNTGVGAGLNYEKIEVNKPIPAALYEHK